MRTYNVLGIQFDDSIVEGAEEIRIYRTGDTRPQEIRPWRNPPQGSPFNLATVREIRNQFLSAYGMDVDRIAMNSILMDYLQAEVETELRRQMSEVETPQYRYRTAPAPLTARRTGAVFPSFQQLRPRDDGSWAWPHAIDCIWWGIEGEASPTFRVVAREDRSPDQDCVRLQIPAIDILYKRIRGEDNTAVSRRKCRLELFKFIQLLIREQFDKDKRDYPNVQSDPTEVAEEEENPFDLPEPMEAETVSSQEELTIGGDNPLQPLVDNMYRAIGQNIDQRVIEVMQAGLASGSGMNTILSPNNTES